MSAFCIALSLETGVIVTCRHSAWNDVGGDNNDDDDSSGCWGNIGPTFNVTAKTARLPTESGLGLYSIYLSISTFTTTTLRDQEANTTELGELEFNQRGCSSSASGLHYDPGFWQTFQGSPLFRHTCWVSFAIGNEKLMAARMVDLFLGLARHTRSVQAVEYTC